MKKQAVTDTQGIRNPMNQDKEPMKKRLLTITETAEYLGRTAWGIRHLIWQGKLPCVKCGKRIHVDIHDLERFIEDNKMEFSY